MKIVCKQQDHIKGEAYFEINGFKVCICDYGSISDLILGCADCLGAIIENKKGTKQEKLDTIYGLGLFCESEYIIEGRDYHINNHIFSIIKG